MSVRLSSRLAARLLRTHVRSGSEDGAFARASEADGRRPREVLTRSVALRCLRETKVQDLHDLVGRDLDIGRLEIAMDDSALVRGFERRRDLERDLQCVFDTEAAS